ncbi:MAG: L-ribulose-5-phosphate 4-epimerase AraD [Spirochaetaceae bacterium]|jgi:L-ribulose-5-phosphate 4-epimerase|nr:L-ribulose-5-phosphate 4-epimerase AraD [Spirochaetaceae bacterium]
MSIYKSLKDEAFEANMEIPARNLAIYTWGNVSAFDSDKAVFAIKPSGVPYDKLKADDIVVVDLEGKVVEGSLRYSSDTPTHLVLYKAWYQGEYPQIRGITHTHSTFGVAWAQAHKSVPCYGTTHADHGPEDIPCTEFMSAEMVKRNYELETGNLIVDTYKKLGKNPSHMPMCLVAGHGPFAWGNSASNSVYNAAVLEEVCKMAYLTLQLNPAEQPLPEHIMMKHWERKHGPGAYYGQK